MPKGLIAAILLFCVLAVGLPAQNEDDWYLGRPISDITFVGLDNVSESELSGVVRQYIGQDFTETRFLDLQRRLYALDFFEQIVPSALPANEDRSEVIIEFAVVERPIVDELRFTGNRSLRSRELQDAIVLAEGDIVTNAKIRSASSALRDLYIERGYPNAEINGRIEEENDLNVVVFTIVEGAQTTIRELQFSGNSFASDGTLRSTIESRAQSLFNRGVFQEGQLDLDRSAIEAYYRERGYIDARVFDIVTDFVQDEEEDRTFVTVTFFIEEGDQWTFGGIEFSGNAIFSDEELHARTRMSPGDILNQNRFEADFQRVADLYYENGYIFNEISRAESRAPEDLTVSYTVRIVERDRARIENIIIRGNTKTRDEVIYREIPLEVGEVFSATRIRQGLQNLYNTQYFSAITPDTPQGSAEGLMDLIVNVEEGSTADIRFGLAFGGSADFPVSAMIRWQDINFLGRGQTVSAETNLSPISQRLSLGFQERWLFGRRWSGGVSLNIDRNIRTGVRQDRLGLGIPEPYENSDDYDGPFSPVPSEYLMEYESVGVSIGSNTGYRWITPIGRVGVGGGLRTRAEWLDYDRDIYRPFNETTRDNWQSWRFKNSLNNYAQLDTRNLVFNPSTGHLVRQDVTFTGGLLRGDSHFIRTDSKLERYFTLLDLEVFENWNWKMVLAGQSLMSVIWPWDQGLHPSRFRDQEGPIASESDRLAIDGMFNARGWGRETNLLALWNNWLELRMPLAQDVIWLDGFLEGAVPYEDRGEIRNTDIESFKFSTGFGLRFVIPQFPIRLYLARRFRVIDGDVEWQTGSLFNQDGSEGQGWDFVFSIGTELF